MSNQGSEALTDSLSVLGQLIISEESIESTAARIVQLAIDLIERVDLGGISLMVGGEVETLGASEALVKELDQIQYELHEGPCLTSLLEQATFQVDDFLVETRWPRFSPRMAEHGIVGLIAFALKVNGRGGALNLYTRHAGGFDRETGVAGAIFAAQALVALTNAQTHATDVRRMEELEQGMLTRDIIGTAVGILMERESCTHDEAFELLKRTSQNLNVKLRDVAGGMIQAHPPAPTNGRTD